MIRSNLFSVRWRAVLSAKRKGAFEEAVDPLPGWYVIN